MHFGKFYATGPRAVCKYSEKTSKKDFLQDSYVLRYFKSLAQFLSVGPSVYFVVKGPYEYGEAARQNMLCGGAGCYQDSLYGQVYSAAYWKNR